MTSPHIHCHVITGMHTAYMDYNVQVMYTIATNGDLVCITTMSLQLVQILTIAGFQVTVD